LIDLRSFVLRSLDEMPAHEPGWEALRRQCNGTVYSSHILTSSWLQTFERSAKPRIIVVEEEGDIVGLAPLCSYRYKVKGIPIKMLSLVGDMRDRLKLSTNSLLYLPGRADVLERILKEIKKLDWSFLWTINMERTPEIDRYIDEVREAWYPIEAPGKNLVTVTLPPEGDVTSGFDKNAKKNLQKNMRKLERDGHQARLKTLVVEDIGQAVELYARQHIERWGSRGGSYFRDPENVSFLKLALRAAMRQGGGFAYELLIDGKVAAQNFGFVDGNQAYSYRTGMDDQFMKYSPGWMIRQLDLADLRDRGVERCQIGAGNEHYKQELGGEMTPLVGIGAARGTVSMLARLPMLSPSKITGPGMGGTHPASTGE
jgi:CelD/BcsL family acetyltransferase involved in cellulose biosynthesis